MQRRLLQDYLNSDILLSMASDNERIGQLIALHRRNKRISQGDLARIMREAGHDTWAQNTVSRVELGKQNLRMNEIETLREVLDADLLYGTDLSATIQRTGRQAMLMKAQDHARHVRNAMEELDIVLSRLEDDIESLKGE